MSNHSDKDNYLTNTVRPIWMTSFGKWNTKKRLYEKLLPTEQYAQCIETCKLPLEGINSRPENMDMCINYCKRYTNQQMNFSEAQIGMKMFCPQFDFIKESDFECVKKNKTKILKHIKKNCKDDETCNILNKNVIKLVTDTKTSVENYYTGARDYTLLIILSIVGIILLFISVVWQKLIKD